MAVTVCEVQALFTVEIDRVTQLSREVVVLIPLSARETETGLLSFLMGKRRSATTSGLISTR